MSTLTQIEAAVVDLPSQDQWSLLKWLQKRLATKSEALKSEPESLKLFRQLQQEAALTAEGAQSWKDSVAAARR